MAQATRDAEGFVQSISNIPENEDFVVYGTIHAHPESADALEAVYAETTRLAQSEPGTVYYCICRVSSLQSHKLRITLTRKQDQDDRTMFHMFERYQGKAAFDAHNKQPIIQKLIHEWKYIRGVKAWFPPANLDTTTRLPELQSTQEARSEI
jgi:quinol monooxygenase YgiN